MPQPRSREHDSLHRSNRSMSPAEKKNKRSWLTSSHDRSPYHHSPPKKREFKQPSNFHQSSSSYSRRSRSRSPKYQRRNFGNVADSSKYSSRTKSPLRGDKDFSSRNENPRKRSSSAISSSKNQYDNYRDRKYDNQKPKHTSRSPESSRYHGQSYEKKLRPSSPSLPKKMVHDRSPSPASYPSKKYQSSGITSERESSIPQRKVSNSTRKKISYVSLHNRFTTDDTDSFELQAKDNVTIAILRNPNAIPSDDITVKRIFDSSLFKMVHKKTNGRKPIFDREEIKVWRHDENMEDDPDFEERRLVRVKSASKKPADSSTRKSPDILRRDLQPDSRYESKYQQQTKKEGDRRGRGGREEEFDRFQSRGEDRGRQSRGEDYDLRQALEKRRSGKDEDFDRGNRNYSGTFKYQDYNDRNVILDQVGRRFGSGADEEMERGRGWEVERRGRGRGRGRGPRRRWSPRRTDRPDREEFNSRDRGGGGYNRRDRFSQSPISTRGWGGGNFRGRGRDSHYSITEYTEDRGSPPVDDYYKYAQHDDRDVSPRRFTPRGRFQSRGPGRFRGSRGGFRGGPRGRGFRSSARGRGYYRQEDSRSVDVKDRRSLEHASDKEWKHDMYDSVQSDEEVPHSTTVTN